MKSSLVWPVLAIAVSAACGCGSNDPGDTGGNPESCAEHPLECPDGQTCSFAEGGIFTCQPSGQAQEGEVCTPLLGEPTCGDDLICIKKTGSDMGNCAKLCDPTLGDQCSGMLCEAVQLDSGEQTHACL